MCSSDLEISAAVRGDTLCSPQPLLMSAATVRRPTAHGSGLPNGGSHMACWIKWLLPSAVIAAGLTAVAGVVAFGSIAQDVVGRSAEALKADGHGWARLAISGRDLTLTGLAPDPEHRELAAGAADRVFGVRVVDDRVTVLPLAAPYGFSVVREIGRAHV